MSHIPPEIARHSDLLQKWQSLSSGRKGSRCNACQITQIKAGLIKMAQLRDRDLKLRSRRKMP